MATSIDSEQVIILSKWAVSWIRYAYDRVLNGSPVTKCASKLLVALEECEDSPMDFVEEHVVTLKKKINGETILKNEKSTKKLAKGCRSKFAMCIAKIVYLKYGRRDMTEANVMVTRKFLVKLLDEPDYKDLRTCDKVNAIDRALFLSFVPTMSYNSMKLVSDDSKFAEMLNGTKTLFGRCFTLRSDPPQ